MVNRISALRVNFAFRTVSTVSTLVIERMMPLPILVDFEKRKQEENEAKTPLSSE